MRNVLASTEERIFFKDLESRFLLVSEGVLASTGQRRSLDEVLGKTDAEFFSEAHATAALADERRVIETGKAMPAKIERETFHDRPDAWVSTTKLPLRDRRGEIVGCWGVSRDVTAQIMAEQALAHQALHDSVTGLANRVALTDRLTQALVALERRSGRVGVLFVDLDNFKDVNDSLGHDAGDELLVEVGRRLTSVARRVDTVARFGGDEFVLLCAHLEDEDDLRLIGDRVIRALRAPVTIAGHNVAITGSLGLAETADPLCDSAEILRWADVAMYAAKQAGRDGFQVFEAGRDSGVVSTAGLAGELLRALERSELFVLYQPLFRLNDGSLSGAEALVRWRHPERGIVLPGEFIPLAEERGLVVAIDSFVLDEACRQMAAWQAEIGRWDDFVVSVNVSGRQLRDPGLVERVAGTLERHQITPSCLCLEITETALIGDLNHANVVLESLSRLGVRLALDDFGTGYSTLAHLQRLHTDILKIDRGFIAQAAGQPRDAEIVAAVTAMAHALGMTVVGEGIETNGQLDALIAVNCDQGQGYIWAPPIPPAELAALQAASLAAQPQATALHETRSARGGSRAA